MKGLRCIKRIVFIFISLVIILMITSQSVQGTEKIGKYEIDDQCITKVLPNTTLSNFINDLATDNTVEVTTKEGNEVTSDNIIGTGMVAKIENDLYNIAVIGDLSGDGEIGIADVVKMKLANISIITLTDAYMKAADLNSDGAIGVADMVGIALIKIGIKSANDYIVPTNPTNPTDPEGGFYATLYDDGTLVFTATDREIEGKIVAEKYGKVDESFIKPWESKKDQIKYIDIADKIVPSKVNGLFKGLSNLERIDNLTNLDTSKTTNMSYMFDGCKKLVNLDLSSFDTSNVTSMTSMFAYCENLEDLNLTSFNTNKVKNMQYMFMYCKNLENLNLTSFDTNNATNMGSMFYNCINLSTINVGKQWGMENASPTGMFDSCKTNHVTYIEDRPSAIYATLYNDGTLVFTATDKEIEGKNVSKKYGNIEEYIIRPWENEAKEIKYIDIADKVIPLKTNNLFKDLSNLEEIINIVNLDTSNVTDMQYMFAECESLENLDLSSFDTSNVTNMMYMFSGCKKLENLNISSFDTSNVLSMKAMFERCLKLSALNISNFNTSEVKYMGQMFYSCINLSQLDLSSFDTSNVIDMSQMFHMFLDDSKLTNLDLSNFNTSKVTDMKSMFCNCENLASINLSSFDTSKVTDMNCMFWGCKSLENLDLSNFDTSNVTRMDAMFGECEKLFNLDLSNFNTSKVINMEEMFDHCMNLGNLNLNGWDTSNVVKMNYMFQYCKKLTNLDISNFNTEKVNNFCNMFSYCESLTSILVGENWTTENWSIDTYNSNMFYKCGTDHVTLKSNIPTTTPVYATFYTDGTLGLCSTTATIPGKTVSESFGDVSDIDTSDFYSVPWRSCSIKTVEIVDEIIPKTTSSWFRRSSVEEIRNIQNLNTSHVTDMSDMFNTAYKLTSLDLSNLNTSKVTNMSGMFAICHMLTNLDLSNLDTSNVTNMSMMFSGCNALTNLDLSSFDTSNVTDMSDMFYECSALTKILVGNGWTTANANTDGMFGGCGVDHVTTAQSSLTSFINKLKSVIFFNKILEEERV